MLKSGFSEKSEKESDREEKSWIIFVATKQRAKEVKERRTCSTITDDHELKDGDGWLIQKSLFHNENTQNQKTKILALNSQIKEEFEERKEITIAENGERSSDSGFGEGEIVNGKEQSTVAKRKEV